MTICLYYLNGKRILQTQELLSKGQHTYSLSGLNSGTYILNIESGKNSYSERIVSIGAATGIPEIKSVDVSSVTDKQNSLSDNEKMMCLKNDKAVIDMQFNIGDTLKFTGISGIYSTISVIVPTQNQTFTFNFADCSDPDGNHYAVVQIETQLWMAENLNSTKYQNGDPIPNITGVTAWTGLTTGAYCDYNNDPLISLTYGKLYNFYAASDPRNIAPVGWHVPTKAEVETLLDAIGGFLTAGGKLKESSTSYWATPNLAATDEYGFGALPAGSCLGGGYENMGNSGHWWTSYGSGTGYAYRYIMKYNFKTVDISALSKKDGYSVRCVKN